MNLYTCLLLDKDNEIVNQFKIENPSIKTIGQELINIDKLNKPIFIGEKKLIVEFFVNKVIDTSKICSIRIFNKKVKYNCYDIDIKESHGKVIIETLNYTIH